MYHQAIFQRYNTFHIDLLLVEQHLCRVIIEAVSESGEFESNSKEGIAFQIDVEDAVGVMHQIEALEHTVEEKI